MIFMKYIIFCGIPDFDISRGWLRVRGLRIVHFGVVYGGHALSFLSMTRTEFVKHHHLLVDAQFENMVHF